MRIVKQTAPKTLNLKPVTYHYTSRRKWVVLSSWVILTLMAALYLAPGTVRQWQLERADRQFIAAVAGGYAVAAAEDLRVAEESAIMKEFNALRVTLYCEAYNYNEADMLAIADNVFSRMDSASYPDTIYDVVNEVRTRADNGKKVAMYSYIFTDCPSSQKATGKWRLAGRMAAVALKERWDGKPSSGSVNYHAPYVDPTWATADVRNCLLKPLGERGYHLHYAAVEPQDRAACREERKLVAARAAAEKKAAQVAKAETKNLPKKIPVPTPRPQRIEDVILAAAS